MLEHAVGLLKHDLDRRVAQSSFTTDLGDPYRATTARRSAEWRDQRLVEVALLLGGSCAVYRERSFICPLLKKNATGIARLTQKRNSRHMPAGSEPVAASPGAEGATAVFTRSRTPDTPRKLVDFVAANFASFVDCASTRHVQPMEKRQNSRVARRSHISQNTGLLRCHDSSKLCSDRSPSHRRLA